MLMHFHPALCVLCLFFQIPEQSSSAVNPNQMMVELLFFEPAARDPKPMGSTFFNILKVLNVWLCTEYSVVFWYKSSNLLMIFLSNNAEIIFLQEPIVTHQFDVMLNKQVTTRFIVLCVCSKCTLMFC